VRPVGGTVPTLNPIQRHTIVTEEARLALVEMARVWTRATRKHSRAKRRYSSSLLPTTVADTRLADDALLRAQPEVQQQLQPKEGGDTQ